MAALHSSFQYSDDYGVKHGEGEKNENTENTLTDICILHLSDQRCQSINIVNIMHSCHD